MEKVPLFPKDCFIACFLKGHTVTDIEACSVVMVSEKKSLKKDSKVPEKSLKSPWNVPEIYPGPPAKKIEENKIK